MSDKVEEVMSGLKALGFEILKAADQQDKLMKESALSVETIDVEMENYHRGHRDALLWIVQKMENILKTKVDV